MLMTAQGQRTTLGESLIICHCEVRSAGAIREQKSRRDKQVETPRAHQSLCND